MFKKLTIAIFVFGVFMTHGTTHAESSVQKIAPALDSYQKELVLTEIWSRESLSKRDRGLVTLAILLSRGHIVDVAFYTAKALDEGVKPREISELVTHLAFYSGMGDANAVAPEIAKVFADRGIDSKALPKREVELLPLNEKSEAMRAAFVENTFGTTGPGVVKYTTETLFTDLWLRPGLAPRDRSLITVSALVATGKVEQVPFHLNKALDNGLALSEAQEMLTHLAFYAGWPNVFSAMPVFKSVFEQRAN